MLYYLVFTELLYHIIVIHCHTRYTRRLHIQFTYCWKI